MSTMTAGRTWPDIRGASFVRAFLGRRQRIERAFSRADLPMRIGTAGHLPGAGSAGDRRTLHRGADTPAATMPGGNLAVHCQGKLCRFRPVSPPPCRIMITASVTYANAIATNCCLANSPARGTFHRNTWVVGVAAEREVYRPPRRSPVYVPIHHARRVSAGRHRDCARGFPFRPAGAPTSKISTARFSVREFPRSALAGWTSRLSGRAGILCAHAVDRRNRSGRLISSGRFPSHWSQSGGEAHRSISPARSVRLFHHHAYSIPA